MKSLRRFVVAVVAAASLAGFSIGTAFADPISRRNSVHFSLTCDGQEFTVV